MKIDGKCHCGNITYEAEVNPDFDATQYGVRQKAVKDFGTGVQGNTVRSLDVVIDHLHTLDTAAKALSSR